MRWMKLVALITLTTAAISYGAPTTAHSLVRLGVEARWVPLAEETMTEGGEEFTPQRQRESVGIGLRGLVGFNYFAVGMKTNFTHHVFSSADFNYTQFDANAHFRSLIPKTRLAVFAEAGPTISLNIGSVGYNGGVGMEVDALGWPHVELNLGIAVQYAQVPIGIGPSEIRDHSGFRGIVTLGLDFSLHDSSN